MRSLTNKLQKPLNESHTAVTMHDIITKALVGKHVGVISYTKPFGKNDTVKDLDIDTDQNRAMISKHYPNANPFYLTAKIVKFNGFVKGQNDRFSVVVEFSHNTQETVYVDSITVPIKLQS